MQVVDHRHSKRAEGREKRLRGRYGAVDEESEMELRRMRECGESYCGSWRGRLAEAWQGHKLAVTMYCQRVLVGSVCILYSVYEGL